VEYSGLISSPFRVDNLGSTGVCALQLEHARNIEPGFNLVKSGLVIDDGRVCGGCLHVIQPHWANPPQDHDGTIPGWLDSPPAYYKIAMLLFVF
jgi:hypothetical protein